MPKSKSRRKGDTRSGTSGAYARGRQRATDELTVPGETGTASRATLAAGRPNSMSGLVMSAMVALGCWGFAFTFTFVNDPNRYLFVGMAILLALMWSISFGIRLRRWQRRR